MRSRHPNNRLQNDLTASTLDGILYSVMVGVGEAYVPAFALAIGVGEIAAGLIASVPLIAGATLQLVAPWAVARMRSLKRWVILCAAVQAFAFFPLLAGTLSGRLPVTLLFAAVILYWGAGFATGPAWNAWIETVVPKPIRSRYFASRTRWCQAAVLGGLLVGGALLEGSRALGAPLRGFAIAFVLAAAARAGSVWFMTRQSEPEHAFPEAMGRGFDMSPAGRHLLAYMISVQVAVWVAAPFFTPYMLHELRLSYAGFTIITATAFLARILVMPVLGSLAHRSGARRLLRLGGLAVIPISGLWALSDDFLYLLVLQLLAGVAWAAYELGTFLLFFEAIPRPQRIGVLTLFNFVHAAALVTGSLLGAGLLYVLGPSKEAYLVLFLISSALRVLTALLLIRLPDVAIPAEPIGTRTIAVRPSTGFVGRPVLPSLADEDNGSV